MILPTVIDHLLIWLFLIGFILFGIGMYCNFKYGEEKVDQVIKMYIANIKIKFKKENHHGRNHFKRKI